MNGNQLERAYKEHLSDFKDWKDRPHSSEWLIFPENIGPYLSIDETAISRGDVYTILSNKSAHCGKGNIVAIARGVKSDEIIICRFL